MQNDMYSAAQRHANIKTRSERVQHAHVNAFHVKRALGQRVHRKFIVSSWIELSYPFKWNDKRKPKRITGGK